MKKSELQQLIREEILKEINYNLVIDNLKPSDLNKLDDKTREFVQNLLKIGFFTFGTLIGKSLFFGIDEKSAEYLGRVLAAFALGAIPLSMNLVGIRVLNAFENTRYQFISTLITNLFAIIASLIFFIFWKPEQVVIGLAFAFAISYCVGLS